MRMLLASLVACTALLPAAVKLPMPELANPPASDLPQEELAEASAQAVANGLLALLERMRAPDNQKFFPYPPIPQTTTVSYQTKEVRYKEKMVEVGTYKEKYKTVERLVPKKDSYGNITGYEKKQIRVVTERIKTGTKKVKRIVPDPNGPIVRTRKIPIRGEGGPKLVPQGWYGVNGMALYALAKGGLQHRMEVERAVYFLSWMAEVHGLPDTTWDLAWLAIGLAQFETAEAKAITEKLIGKIFDGQNEAKKEDDVNGLWGPVSMDHEAVRRFFEIELELRKQVEAMAAEITAESNDKKKKKLQQAKIKLQKVLHEVLKGQLLITQHGKRLMSCTKNLTTEELEFAGLPYYHYNQLLADMDSTAAAALAASRIAALDRLPKETWKPEPGGFKLSKPGKTSTILGDGLEALWDQVDRKIWYFTPVNGYAVNHAYDDGITLQGVPMDEDYPDLPKPETVRANIAGYAAATWLAPFDQRTANKQKTALTAIESRVVEGLTALLADGPGAAAKNQLYYRRKIQPADLAAAAGEGKKRSRRQKPTLVPVADLPRGIQGDIWEVLINSLALHAGDELRHREIYDRFCYRLLLEQGGVGLWGRDSRDDRAKTTGEAELAIRSAIHRALGRGRIGGANKEPRELDVHRVVHSNHSKNIGVHTDLAFSTIALVYLLEHLDRPIPLDDEAIDAALQALAEEQAKVQEANEAAQAKAEEEAADQEGAEDGEDKPAKKPAPLPEPPRNLAKSNDAIIALWEAILAKQGKSLPKPEVPAEPAPAAEEKPEDEAADSDGDTPTTEQPAAKAEDEDADTPDADDLLKKIMK